MNDPSAKQLREAMLRLRAAAIENGMKALEIVAGDSAIRLGFELIDENNKTLERYRKALK